MRVFCSALAILALSALPACHRPATPAAAPPASAAADDLGGSLLAGVDNARIAIAQGDRLDAANDVNDALDIARQLAGQSSRLFPDNLPSNGAPQPATAARHLGERRNAPAAGGNSSGRRGRDSGAVGRMTKFDAEVRLESASAALQSGDLGTADDALKGVQDSVPPSILPSHMPLLEADESLDMALEAVAGEKPDSLRAQLENAAQRLRTYDHPDHAADAKALASDIEASLSAPGSASSLSTARLGLWSDRIDAWL